MTATSTSADPLGPDSLTVRMAGTIYGSTEMGFPIVSLQAAAGTGSGRLRRHNRFSRLRFRRRAWTMAENGNVGAAGNLDPKRLARSLALEVDAQPLAQLGYIDANDIVQAGVVIVCPAEDGFADLLL